MARPQISVADLEKAMGRKADHISDWEFDPETGGFKRHIKFSLAHEKSKPKPPTKRKR